MSKIDRDIKILTAFIELYCKHHHKKQDLLVVKDMELTLCSECYDLLKYALKRREKCPKNPKPACKNCDTHCYEAKYQNKIRQVMKYSGKKFISEFGLRKTYNLWRKQ